jgi:predicted aldo/keto reductase-like oxidoreductase
VKSGRLCSRRAFLSQGLAGLASFGLAGSSVKNLFGLRQEGSLSRPAGGIITRPLGKTGERLPVVSMGVMNSNNPDLVRAAYERGVRHFDTAATYMRGRNEEMVGKVIKELGARDEVLIATKIPPLPSDSLSDTKVGEAKAYCLDSLDRSLKRLQTDYVDMLYLHDVQDVSYLQNAGIRSALETARSQKKARWIGFSTHLNMAALLEEAVRGGCCDAVLTAYNYSMSENAALLRAMEKAAGAGIILVAMKTQCKQPWYLDEFQPGARKFYEGQIKHTALLKWVLRHECVATAVPGFQNFQELDEDFSVVRDLGYSPEEKKFLEDHNVKLAMRAVCQQCSSCLSTCPERVDVPRLVRAHMYAASYPNIAQARATLEEIPRARGLERCMACGECKARCVNTVNLAARIAELKALCA